jgi:endonuclease-8
VACILSVPIAAARIMPEGPSIVILKEAVESFTGKKILRASGNSKKVDFDELTGEEVLDFKSWGKHFLICFRTFTLRIHFLMFGSYSINEFKENRSPRLSLLFAGEKWLNFYACSILTIREPLDTIYDWSTDVMNPAWSSTKATKKLKAAPKLLVCDVLLDQNIFAGVGNIIKNEVLYRIRVHPKSKIGKLSAGKMKELIREAVQYSFQFLEWKKEFTLRKHWLVHTKTICTRDGQKIVKEYLGKTNRRSFFCPKCQRMYV